MQTFSCDNPGFCILTKFNNINYVYICGNGAYGTLSIGVKKNLNKLQIINFSGKIR
jgi:hypothetical protein